MYKKEKLNTKKEFNKDTLEKVYRLCDILDYINKEQLLSKHLVLKGGTAINLFITDMPRLSVDIDLDFNENCNKEEMLEQRNVITNLIKLYMENNNYILEGNTKNVAALDSMVYSYVNDHGNKDVIKIEINYLMRNHILKTKRVNKHIDVLDRDISMTILDKVELYGAKIKALIERGVARDLFDIANMIKVNLIDDKDISLLKKCFIFYITVGNSKSKEYVKIDYDKINKLKFIDVKRKLLPVLNNGMFYDLENEKILVKEYLDKLLVLNKNEKEYIEEFKKGKYKPELLFDDNEIIERIKNHPMALWKIKL